MHHQVRQQGALAPPAFEAARALAGCAVCVVVPAYNEADAIGKTIAEYKAAFPTARIVVVDNNSSDGTAEAALAALDGERDLLLREPRKGKGNAVKRGISRLEADVFIVTDGDATYPAEDARRLVDVLLDSRADMVVGDRVSEGAYDAQNTRPGHGMGNRLLTFLVSALAGERYRDVLSGLRVMSAPFVAALDIRSTGFELETEMSVVAAWLRADVIESPIRYRHRVAGSASKLDTLRDGIDILYFALTNWIAFAPMQAFALFAAMTLTVSAILSYRIVVDFFAYGWPSTTTAIVAAACALAGTLALFTGMMLRIQGRNERRQEIARFLSAKRAWNARLDARQL